MFYLTRAALPHLRAGAAIVNSNSVAAYKGKPSLVEYSATKGAIAPGPIWTPLIPATVPVQDVESFEDDKPLGRAGQPVELAPSYVFLASKDSSYMTVQVLHPNGGTVVAG